MACSPPLIQAPQLVLPTYPPAFRFALISTYLQEQGCDVTSQILQKELRLLRDVAVAPLAVQDEPDQFGSVAGYIPFSFDNPSLSQPIARQAYEQHLRLMLLELSTSLGKEKEQDDRGHKSPQGVQDSKAALAKEGEALLRQSQKSKQTLSPCEVHSLKAVSNGNLHKEHTAAGAGTSPLVEAEPARRGGDQGKVLSEKDKESFDQGKVLSPPEEVSCEQEKTSAEQDKVVIGQRSALSEAEKENRRAEQEKVPSGQQLPGQEGVPPGEGTLTSDREELPAAQEKAQFWRGQPEEEKAPSGQEKLPKELAPAKSGLRKPPAEQTSSGVISTSLAEAAPSTKPQGVKSLEVTPQRIPLLPEEDLGGACPDQVDYEDSEAEESAQTPVSKGVGTANGAVSNRERVSGKEAVPSERGFSEQEERAVSNDRGQQKQTRDKASEVQKVEPEKQRPERDRGEFAETSRGRSSTPRRVPNGREKEDKARGLIIERGPASRSPHDRAVERKRPESYHRRSRSPRDHNRWQREAKRGHDLPPPALPPPPLVRPPSQFFQRAVPQALSRSIDSPRNQMQAIQRGLLPIPPNMPGERPPPGWDSRAGPPPLWGGYPNQPMPRGMQMDVRGGQIAARGGQMDARGAQMDARVGQRDTRGIQRDARGFQRDARAAQISAKGSQMDARGSHMDARSSRKRGWEHHAEAELIQGYGDARTSDSLRSESTVPLKKRALEYGGQAGYGMPSLGAQWQGQRPHDRRGR